MTIAQARNVQLWKKTFIHSKYSIFGCLCMLDIAILKLWSDKKSDSLRRMETTNKSWVTKNLKQYSIKAKNQALSALSSAATRMVTNK